MSCFICGDEEIVARRIQGRAICAACSADTPEKLGRREFDARYWAGEAPNDPPENTRREFYADYLASTSTYDDYAKRTVSDY